MLALPLGWTVIPALAASLVLQPLNVYPLNDVVPKLIAPLALVPL